MAYSISLSTLCAHSYSRSAISDIIDNSVRIGRPPTCPVTGCNARLTKADLKVCWHAGLENAVALLIITQVDKALQKKTDEYERRRKRREEEEADEVETDDKAKVGGHVDLSQLSDED